MPCVCGSSIFKYNWPSPTYIIIIVKLLLVCLKISFYYIYVPCVRHKILDTWCLNWGISIWVVYFRLGSCLRLILILQISISLNLFFIIYYSLILLLNDIFKNFKLIFLVFTCLDHLQKLTLELIYRLRQKCILFVSFLSFNEGSISLFFNFSVIENLKL